jgi:hypothetical protein
LFLGNALGKHQAGCTAGKQESSSRSHYRLSGPGRPASSCYNDITTGNGFSGVGYQGEAERAACYEASLELHKIYPVLPDPDAAQDRDLRIIDESGEDYLYAASRFVAIEVPKALERAVLKRAS